MSQRSLLITGGSGGIGAATARLAGARGWLVFVGYNAGRGRAEAVVRDVEAAGGSARAVRISLEDSSTIVEAAALVKRDAAGLDAAVLCAGLPPPTAPFLKTGEDDLLAQLRLAAGHQRLIAELWKAVFMKAGKGRVVAVSSEAAGAPPWPGMSAYVVGKRALEASLECAAAELRGLRVDVIRPGYVETPMIAALNPHFQDAIRAKAGPKGLIAPETVAAEILALLG